MRSETLFITLHSVDAGILEVGMSLDKLVAIVHWYRRQNPQVWVGERPQGRGGR